MCASLLYIVIYVYWHRITPDDRLRPQMHCAQPSRCAPSGAWSGGRSGVTPSRGARTQACVRAEVAAQPWSRRGVGGGVILESRQRSSGAGPCGTGESPRAQLSERRADQWRNRSRTTTSALAGPALSQLRAGRFARAARVPHGVSAARSHTVPVGCAALPSPPSRG